MNPDESSEHAVPEPPPPIPPERPDPPPDAFNRLLVGDEFKGSKAPPDRRLRKHQ